MEVASDYLVAADAALNRGDTQKALTNAVYASMLAVQGPLKAQAEQLAGICHRLLGNYESADNIFNVAYGYAEDNLHRGRIKRDWGMVYLDQAQPDKAMELFIESQLLLVEAVGPDDPRKEEAQIEYFVTLGFIGRAHLAQGDIAAARDYMHSADLQLKGHAPYELNNLVWRLKASPFQLRRKLFPRAWQLAREAGHRQRQVQVVLTTISPALARRLVRRR